MKKVEVVEVMGLPNGGKTTYIDGAVRELSAQGFLIRSIQDQIRDAPVANRVAQNLWAVRTVGILIAEAREQALDLIIVERGAGALRASLMVLLEQTREEPEKEEARRGMVLADDLVRDEDFFILVQISPTVSLKRDRRKGLSRPGSIINQSFLDGLAKAYEEIREKLPSSKVRVIDGGANLSDNQREMTKILRELIEADKNGNSQSFRADSRGTSKEAPRHG